VNIYAEGEATRLRSRRLAVDSFALAPIPAGAVEAAA
jgi:hypothetical protein